MLRKKSITSVYLAIDLGAGSGRVIAGICREGDLELEEINRFENTPIEEGKALYWDFENLWGEIINGLSIAAKQPWADKIRSIGVDTWGVDYGLLGADNNLLKRPRNYRDPRTDGAMDEVFGKISREAIFGFTGIQFMQLNTLYQMHAELRDNPDDIAAANQFLLIPDLINLRLSGQTVCERTNASTTQLYDPQKKDWAWEIFDTLGLPRSIAPDFIDAGDTVGHLLPELVEKTGLAPTVSVVAVGSHDTASAVAGVPSESGSQSAFLSSGTWSLLGAESSFVAISEKSKEYNFTNEVGVCDTIRLLKNINGLWIIQEARRIWAEAGDDRSYAELSDLTEKAPSLKSFIDPDAPQFTARGDMPTLVQQYCCEADQDVPQDAAEILRVVTESLAMKYRFVLGRLEELLGQRMKVIHVIGGGGQNRLLNQCIANALGRPVIVGPFEATAAGNILMQMLASEEISTIAEGRALVRSSMDVEEYTPQDTNAWLDAYDRFLRLIEPATTTT